MVGGGTDGVVAQRGPFLPPLRPAWCLSSHLSKDSSLCLQTGYIVPLCHHGEGTDCSRLGACSGLLLGTSITPP